MLQFMCKSCGYCDCPGNPCKPHRAYVARPRLGTANKATRIDKDLAHYPEHIRAQIRAKLAAA